MRNGETDIKRNIFMFRYINVHSFVHSLRKTEFFLGQIDFPPNMCIIILSRPVSGRYAPMSMIDRGAQFSPFAALTGYDDVIAETGLPTARMLATLTLLQVKGIVKQHPGKRISLK